MDISHSLAIRLAVLRASAALGLAVLASTHHVALAKEAPLPPTEQAPQGGEDGPAPADRPIEGTDGRVFLAAEVGEVSVDRAADAVGRKVYADRSQVAGSAAVVSFSSSPPRPKLAGLSNGRLNAPLPRATVTSRFGALRAQGGGGTRTHAGVDLAAPQGSPVTAALEGRVSVANWAGSYGLLVVLDHPGGIQTRYAHLSSIAVAPGQAVQQGQLLGQVGSTGRSTGPHLHYELRQDGRPLDPLATGR